MAFQELRLIVQPSLQNAGQWSIGVQKAPEATLLGFQALTAPAVTVQEIARLRNPTAPADIAMVKALGKNVLSTLTPNGLLVGLKICLNQAKANNHVLRLVVAIVGDNTAANGSISTRELPIEATFEDSINFLGTNIRTPVSRGVTVEADRAAVRVDPPLRILVVATEPNGMPPVNAAVERAAIKAALKPLLDVGGVVLDFCSPPSLDELGRRLLGHRYHVVHFIGHGDFEPVGVDPSPQPHVYFEDSASQEAVPVDAERFHTVLANGDVPLVVLTACSSAATQPRGNAYPGMAFEGLAQALVMRPSGPLAAVAMQFDFETSAAAIFSKALYEKLLVPGWSVDQAVSAARSALFMDQKFGPGHRAWINPTVYTRCTDGMVFALNNTSGQLTDEQRTRIKELDLLIAEYEKVLADIRRQPAEEQAALATLRDRWRKNVEELIDQRGSVFGESVRLRGGLLGDDDQITCSLTVVLRTGAAIGDVRVSLKLDPALFELVDQAGGASQGADVGGPPFIAQGLEGARVFLVQNASAGQIWNPGEREVAKVKLRYKGDRSIPLVRVPLADASVVRNTDAAQPIQTLEAVVFLAS